MRLWEIARFELRYQLHRSWTWLFVGVLLVFAVLMTRDGSLAEALHDDFLLNSPFAIAKTMVTGCLLWLLLAAVVAGEAGARDVATGMYPLLYTAPLRKAEYLGGRFLAAMVLNALILLAVPAGILIAVSAPGVDAAILGPFRPAAYLTAYVFIALPNVLAATALQFALAVRSGRPMAGYLASVLLFAMSYVVGLFLVLQGRQDLANLLDPIGVHFILSELSHLWTPFEKSWRLLALEGTVLTNRLVWLGGTLVVLAISYLRFGFGHRTASGWLRWPRRRATRALAPANTAVTARPPVAIPQVRRTFGVATHARQTLAIAGASFRTLATSWAGVALLAAIPLLVVPVVLDQMELNGVPLAPTTARVIGELTAPLSAELSRWVIVPLLIAFFAGELVWRERDAGLGEIVDALPGSDWAPFLGKLLGLGLVLTLFMALLTAAGMLAQQILGYQRFEVGLYLSILFGLQLPEYLLFACLALVLHVLVDQKYVGHLVAIMAFMMIALAGMFGIEHNLLIYGAGPAWSYTEMRGFGASLGPWIWFKLYWAAWALLLAVAARLLWVRGWERALAERLRTARRRLTGATAFAAAVAAALMLVCGGYIFRNTNVVNTYRSAADRVAAAAAYERRYSQYADMPQPQLTGTTLHVEIYPERRAVTIRGTYRLANRSAEPIAAVHVATVPAVVTGAVAFDRGAALRVDDAALGYRIYDLERPLQPADALQLDFQVDVAPHGFAENGVDEAVAANGTSFTGRDWLPAIGYQPERELTSARDRRAQGLAPRPLIAALSDAEAGQDFSGPGGIAFEAVVGTAADQVAVAPGALRQTWTEGERRYFRYAADAPIGTEYAFFSARYALHEARWQAPGAGQAVAIMIYHHPNHASNLDRMVRSIQASLDYYTAQFGPYPHRQISVVERPGNGVGLHAEPGMITYSEGFSTWRPTDDGTSVDLPFALMAHEMAHQWTVPYARVEGAPFLSEGLAWYSAMQAVKAARGDAELGRLLSFMRQPYPYPPIRHGEPLLRAIDPYLAYRKGPFALYALSEYIGEERVNGALRRLVERARSGTAPPATTLDLYRELQAVTPVQFQPLLHDLFEANTFWELTTEQATAEQTATGTWQVTLDVRARKVVVDETGVETEVPMDDWVEVGVFGPAAAGSAGEPLSVELRRIHAGAQRITVTVPRKPALAGVDPHHLLDWEERDDDDNIVGVELAPAAVAP